MKLKQKNDELLFVWQRIYTNNHGRSRKALDKVNFYDLSQSSHPLVRFFQKHMIRFIREL
ncbi:hypothetical protein BO224_11310 [Erysipelotrichaceae bacterium NYU-BL-E8]|uniref:Uncharacterized protein n=1 Tax=Ileibacterium valens TaxID=1862668 RepID=A0A1U7NCT4_9FIRM|nr:hypothetical protein BO222_12400 [Ileibacterium valens]OLU37108.1 hypothetical protein BM735_11350 [Erysipelotrichaceae bacterium NYU-BL-F16]OLU37223.1 hypothetical protein BO224_11310 [Erysipelotrichaceae bacterium NYU-BL-E8]